VYRTGTDIWAVAVPSPRLPRTVRECLPFQVRIYSRIGQSVTVSASTYRPPDRRKDIAPKGQCKTVTGVLKVQSAWSGGCRGRKKIRYRAVASSETDVCTFRNTERLFAVWIIIHSQLS